MAKQPGNRSKRKVKSRSKGRQAQVKRKRKRHNKTAAQGHARPLNVRKPRGTTGV